MMTESYFNGKTVEVIDRYQFSHPFESFAFDDYLQHQISNDHTPKIRFWVHDPFIILGLQDARLPKLGYGLDFLDDSGYEFIVRNSGGLGVVLDEGVLNISLILDKADFHYIENGYDIMYELISQMFSEDEVKAYEIIDSYCPGSYDLSIDGKKFAGISQRRIKNGVAVQIYLSVTGSGADRAKLMKDFYYHAEANTHQKFTYPDINPANMASINELLEMDLTIDQVEKRALKVLGDMGAELKEYRSQEDETIYEQLLNNIKERNNKYLAGH